MTKVSEDLSQFNVAEGDDAAFYTIEQTRELTMAPTADEKAISIIEKYLNK